MEVIGAGFARTGTKSLQEALEILGYGKCYHMVTLFGNPQDIKYWEAAATGQKVEWEKLFDGCKSVVDFPGSFYYKELMSKYPDAKIILSKRDAESWYNSAYSTIYSFNPGVKTKLKLVSFALFNERARNLLRIVKMNKLTIWDRLFQKRFEDKDFAIKVFNDHIRDTIQYVPKEKLLVFEAKDGWGPLCEFLNKPIPSVPYPKLNSKEDFHVMTKDFLNINK